MSKNTLLGIGSCEICTEQYKNDTVPACLPCGHVFCNDCLHRINNKACPTCRRTYDTDQIRRVFATVAGFEDKLTPSSYNEPTPELAKAVSAKNARLNRLEADQPILEATLVGLSGIFQNRLEYENFQTQQIQSLEVENSRLKIKIENLEMEMRRRNYHEQYHLSKQKQTDYAASESVYDQFGV